MFFLFIVFMIGVSLYIWKLRAFLVILILIIGGLITCGGNLFLASFGYGGAYGADLISYWFLEIFLVGIGGIYYISSKYPKLDFRQKKILYYILGVAACIAVIILFISINII